MCGRATLAMLVSSTSMKVAMVTVPAITHGLMAGSPAAGRVAVAIGMLPRLAATRRGALPAPPSGSRLNDVHGMVGPAPARTRGWPGVLAAEPGARPGPGPEPTRPGTPGPVAGSAFSFGASDCQASRMRSPALGPVG